MKKYDKSRLLQVMGRLDKTFKPNLNEGMVTVKNDAGEPIGTEYQPDAFDPQDEPEVNDREIGQRRGIGNFNNIDWKLLHEQLVLNTEILKEGGRSTRKHLAATVNDLTDEDGMLTLEELRHLDDWQIIYIDGSFPNIGGSFPEIEDEKYLDFNTFKTKAAEIWNKEPQQSHEGRMVDDAPYLRGYEPMSENKKRIRETGEWSGDEDDIAWMEELKKAVEIIATETGGKLKLIDIEGFDKYQGPYAIVEIDGKKYNIWTLEEYGEMWIEDFPYDNTSGEGKKAGFEGTIPEIVNVINNTGAAPRNQMYKSFSLNETGEWSEWNKLNQLKNNETFTRDDLKLILHTIYERAYIEDKQKLMELIEFFNFGDLFKENKSVQEGRSGLQRMTVFLMYDKNGSYLGDLAPIDEEQRASEFYQNTKSEVLATPEFQKFAQEKNITPDQIGRIKRDSEYTMDGNPLSFEYYAASDSQELYDSKTKTWYNRSGQQLRNPEEYDKTNPEYTPFGDEGDNY